MAYEHLIDTVIDKNNPDYADFPDSLDGEIYTGGDSVAGWFTRPQVPPTQDEINDAIYESTLLNQKILKALIMALNDGTFVPGSNYTAEQIKNGIKRRI